MKRTPLTRKAPLRARAASTSKKVVHLAPKRTKRLRASRSTTTPTKAERAHIERIKHGLCVCCVRNMPRGLQRADQEGCDAHHVLSGGKRRGHLYTLGLCPWHHRGICPGIYPGTAAATRALGPSLANGSKPFHDTYGTDDQLLELQATLTGL